MSKWNDKPVSQEMKVGLKQSGGLPTDEGLGMHSYSEWNGKEAPNGTCHGSMFYLILSDNDKANSANVSSIFECLRVFKSTGFNITAIQAMLKCININGVVRVLQVIE